MSGGPALSAAKVGSPTVEQPCVFVAAHTQHASATTPGSQLTDPAVLAPGAANGEAGPDVDFASFLSSVSRPLSLDPPKSTGLLLQTTLESETADPLLRTDTGEAIELNECAVEWLDGSAEVERIVELCQKLIQLELLRGPSRTAPSADFDCDYYAVLKVPLLASMDLIKRHYKKLSVLVHPDKCANPKANDAFHCLNTAYRELQKPQYRLRFRATLQDARVKLKEQIHEINKLRKRGQPAEAPWYDDFIASGGDGGPGEKVKGSSSSTKITLGASFPGEIVYDETDPRILNRLLELSEEILKDRKERLAHAEEVRRANLLYEVMQHEERAARQYKDEHDLKLWKARQDERVIGWRDFRESETMRKTRLTADTVLNLTSRKKSRLS